MADSQARPDRYDVIVVGGGTGGLVAGGLLAKSGRSVLVLEAEDRPGGFLRSFSTDGLNFDYADHLIMGCNSDGPWGAGILHQILSSLGALEQVSFYQVDPFYAFHHRGQRFVLPAGLGPHVEALTSYFPHEARGIHRLFDLYTAMITESIQMPVRVRLRDMMTMPWRFRVTYRYRKTTLGDLLAQHIKDPNLRAVHTALWPYLGLPASRASSLAWGLMMACYLIEGAFCCNGGFQQLADALVMGLQRQGGHFLAAEPVCRILAERNAVRGVVTASGRQFFAPVVVVNSDPRIALLKMLQGSILPKRYQKKLYLGEVSDSVFAIYTGCEIGQTSDRLAHETVVMEGDSEVSYHRSRAGDTAGVIVTTPTLSDPSRTSRAEHTVVIKALCPAQSSEQEEARIARRMLSLAEQAIPECSDRVSYVYRRTGANPWPVHRVGPMYGWAMTPTQFGPYRLPHRTPINGLWLAGHWSQPAAGVWGAAASGIGLVRTLLNLAPHDPLSPILV